MFEREFDIFKDRKDQLPQIPFSCSLRMGNNSVNLYTNLPGLRGELSRPDNAYSMSIPGWSVQEKPGTGPHSIHIIESNVSGLHYDGKDQILYVLGNPDVFKDGQSIAWLSCWLMEAQRQAKSSFTIHSSALSLDNKGVLLLGHSGSGKTSLVLDLCRRFDGAVISNDLTIVNHDKFADRMTMVDGTKEIRLRLTTVSRNFPDLEHLFPDEQISPWENKIVTTPEEIGIRSSSNQQELKAIFEVHLDSSNDSNLIVQKVSGIGIKYRLYEDMSRIVRASAISVFSNTEDFLGYIPPLDTKELHDNRINCIDYMSKQIGIISVSGGNLHQISNSIKEIVGSI